MRITRWLAARYWAFREAWAFASIYNGYVRGGHPTPFIAATNEIFYRAEYLEAFRDFATDAYLTKGTELGESKNEFIRLNLGRTCILERPVARMLEGIIREMEADEALHTQAYRKWCDEADAIGEELRLEAIALYGPSGRSPLVRRILRGRA